MTSPVVQINLERESPASSWVLYNSIFNQAILKLNSLTKLNFKGFRLQGGTDFRLHLSIKKVRMTPQALKEEKFILILFKVNANTPSHNRLHVGDVIVLINGIDASSLTHLQAHELIKNAGYNLNLVVRK